MSEPSPEYSGDASRSDRRCDWCHGAIPAGARRDAITCSKRCRQARHRFHSDVGSGSRDTSAPLRLAYADPPYPGLADYYEGHPDYAGEVDHADLIRRLCSDFDGWALSTSAASLQLVLSLCPPDVRVASWHRGERPTRARGPLNGWEPVIYRGGRLDVDLSPVDPRRVEEWLKAAMPGVELSSWQRRLLADLEAHPAPRPAEREVVEIVGYDRSVLREVEVSSTWSPRRVDVLEHFSRPRLTDPARVIGAKPARFARWIFDLLGALPQDKFVDLYPGSGGIGRAWTAYSSSALAEATPTERTAP